MGTGDKLPYPSRGRAAHHLFPARRSTAHGVEVEIMFKKFRIRSKLAVGILAAVVATLIGAPVYAHFIYEDGHTYSVLPTAPGAERKSRTGAAAGTRKRA